MSLRLETIAIGDEILTGKISDSNSTFVANEVFNLGFTLQRQTVVADHMAAMEAAIREAAKRADIVACFGGLGPTSDDKTAELVAKIIGGTVVDHEPSKEKLYKYYAERKRAVNSQSLKQVLYPEKATPLFNMSGMAPGFSCRLEGCTFFFFPGVPSEMRPMVKAYFVPEVERRGAEHGGAGKVFNHSWWCLGIWESELQRIMDPVEAKLPKGSWLGYRTKPPENHLSLYYRVNDAKDEAAFEEWKKVIADIVRPWCYSDQKTELEQSIAEGLSAKGLRITLAESCTGGLGAERLTRIPGSSERVWGSFVTYQVAAKKQMLGVDLEKAEDAVSAECTRKLVEACRRSSGTEVAAAITGYLGPTGGTEADPVGTVYIAVLADKLYEQRVAVNTRTREEAKWAASTYLLNAIRIALGK